MIIVVEGISAAGKSHWCARQTLGPVVPETPAVSPPQGLEAAARFWAACNERRWHAALEIEAAHGIAVCDTDPLKLHYRWCLLQIGEASSAEWLAEAATTRRSVASGRVGFASRYFVKLIDPVEARRQRDSDPNRRRHNFDLHLRLQEPLASWYEHLATVSAVPVAFTLPRPDATIAARSAELPHRYSVELFDEFVGSLPTAPGGPR